MQNFYLNALHQIPLWSRKAWVLLIFENTTEVTVIMLQCKKKLKSVKDKYAKYHFWWNSWQVWWNSVVLCVTAMLNTRPLTNQNSVCKDDNIIMSVRFWLLNIWQMWISKARCECESHYDGHPVVVESRRFKRGSWSLNPAGEEEERQHTWNQTRSHQLQLQRSDESLNINISHQLHRPPAASRRTAADPSLYPAPPPWQQQQQRIHLLVRKQISVSGSWVTH